MTMQRRLILREDSFTLRPRFQIIDDGALPLSAANSPFDLYRG